MRAKISAGAQPALVIVYDLLRDPDACDNTCRHGRTWDRLYTNIHLLDADHIALVFRPARDERWREWERVRMECLRGEQAA
jgi:hypothetical protein